MGAYMLQQPFIFLVYQFLSSNFWPIFSLVQKVAQDGQWDRKNVEQTDKCGKMPKFSKLFYDKTIDKTL